MAGEGVKNKLAAILAADFGGSGHLMCADKIGTPAQLREKHEATVVGDLRVGKEKACRVLKPSRPVSHKLLRRVAPLGA